MLSKCPTGTGYRVSHLSHPLFIAETQGLQVSHHLSHLGQRGTVVPPGRCGMLGQVGHLGQPGH